MQRSDVGAMSALSLYSEALRLKLGHEISPRMAIVHPTDLCNQNCTDCEYTHVHTEQPAKLETKVLLDVVDQVADLGAASILFSGGGEPTLHECLGAAIKKANRRGLQVGMFSNGTRIDAFLAECLARNATFIRISVDTANSKTYAAIRQVHAVEFENMKASVKRLVAAKRRVGSKLQISLKFLVRPGNIDEILPFVDLARELKVGGVQYKPVRNGKEALNAEEMKRAQALIEQARSWSTDVKVRGGVSPIIKVKVPCWITSLRVVIAADGYVHLCNYFAHRCGTHTIGNINDTALRDIWFSDIHRKALTTIKVPECELYDCRFHQLNAELQELMEHHRGQLDFI